MFPGSDPELGRGDGWAWLPVGVENVGDIIADLVRALRQGINPYLNACTVVVQLPGVRPKVNLPTRLESALASGAALTAFTT